MLHEHNNAIHNAVVIFRKRINCFGNQTPLRIIERYNTVMHFRKDGITIMFEGSEAEFTGDGSLIKEFFTMYEHITKLECFNRATKHELVVYAVDTTIESEEHEYLAKNPIQQDLIEYACVYHYKLNNYDIHFTIGNFIKNDVEKYDLSPFKTKNNEDLFDSTKGKMCEVKVIELEHDPSLNKLKKVIRDVNKQIELF